MADSSLAERMAALELFLGQPLRFDSTSSQLVPFSNDDSAVKVAGKDTEPIDFDERQSDAHNIEEARIHAETKAREMAERSKIVFNNSSWVLNEPTDNDTEFAPWKLVVLYPTCFIGKTNRPLAKPFFDAILHARVWDFFYLHEVHEPNKNPHVLVPTEQFKYFLDEVNAALGIALTIPIGVNEGQYCMKFGEGGTPRPRYLKRSINDDGLKIEKWPLAQYEDIEAFGKAPIHLQDDWTKQMKKIRRGVPRDVKANAERSARKARQRDQILLDTQKYLGMKPNKLPTDAVLICVDVEAVETSPNCITEVGFAILDTAEVKSLPLTDSRSDWFKYIKAHHLRIREYAGYRNSRYVQGCPDRFDFGNSTFPSIAEVSEEIRAVFRTYTKDQRQLVFVGHDVGSDISYLEKLGVHMAEIQNMIGEVDTKDIYQAWKNEVNGRGLHHLLSALGIKSKNLHNAGNDAYYTLCAAILVAEEALREEQAELKKKASEDLLK